MIDWLVDFAFNTSYTFRPIDMLFWIVLLPSVGAILACWFKRS